MKGSGTLQTHLDTYFESFGKIAPSRIILYHAQFWSITSRPDEF